MRELESSVVGLFYWVERGESHVCEVAILAWGSLQVQVMKYQFQSLLVLAVAAAALVVFE